MLTTGLVAGMAIAGPPPSPTEGAASSVPSQTSQQTAEQPVYLRLPDGRIVAFYPSAGSGQVFAASPSSDQFAPVFPTTRTHASR